MLERFEEFNSLIKQINKEIQKIKNRELKKFGLKGSQMEFIYYLGKNETLSFKEFCELLHSDKAFVSRNVALLKEEGLIVETVNSVNKAIYRLSQKGFEIFKLNRETTERMCNFVYIDENKIDDFYKNLNEISAKLRKIGERDNDKNNY